MHARSPDTARPSDCTHPSLTERGTISLPVLADHNPRGPIRKSKNSRRRAIVLIVVQLLIVVHIVLWMLSKKYGWFGGYTISPIEPSESMEFSKYGVVNAGLIFFVIALLSTLVLGRWFCGWGCHVVLLQDFCGWIMKKCGVRPKPFRSRLLIYVPLILAVYMFILPAVHRWGLVPLNETMTASWGESHWAVQTLRTTSTTLGFPLPYRHMPEWKMTSHLTTNDFWRTFAGYGVAIPFLFVCGFAVVYFLGSKGFCTYGCPYGGFFAPLDKLAPARIMVTDACEGCGHCTATCTSNVRVHEEVREFGMVVDPGCMKCLDCVSVCPNEALYFGFGKPAVMKGPPKSKAPRKIYDFTLGEEFIFAGVFLLTFIAVRGVYGLVPMLMAVGLAGIVTFLTWKLWRVARDPNVTLHRWQLKRAGRVRLSGWAFALAVVLLIGLTAHSGVVNAALARARHYDQKVSEVLPQEVIFSGDPRQPTEEIAGWARQGLKHYALASAIGAGGIGLSRNQQADLDIRRAWLHSSLLDFASAEQTLRQALKREGTHDLLCASTMWVLYAQMRIDDALQLAEVHLLERQEMSQTLETYRRFAQEFGYMDRAFATVRQRLAAFPAHLNTMRAAAMFHFQYGEFAQANELTRRTLQIDPANASGHYFLALGQMELGEHAAAQESIARAHELAPHSIPIAAVMADILDVNGRRDEAARYREKVQQLQAEHMRRMQR